MPTLSSSTLRRLRGSPSRGHVERVNLTLTDGTVYVFGDQAPLQAVRDRYRNQTTVTWTGTIEFGSRGPLIIRVASEGGRPPAPGLKPKVRTIRSVLFAESVAIANTMVQPSDIRPIRQS